MTIREGNQSFSFDDNTLVCKFDETNFYRKFSDDLYGGKGLDVIAQTDNRLMFIEIKDFRADQASNSWRWHIADSKKNKANLGENKHSLDIEVAQKVIMTIACLYGKWIKAGETGELDDKISHFYKYLNSRKLLNDKLKLWIILQVEGIKACHTRSEKTIMFELQKSLKKYLSWMKCKIVVQNSSQANEKGFYLVENYAV